MNPPHLDDERLSAYLDGTPPEGTSDQAATDHLAECVDCRARLDAFRAVAELLGAPVTPPVGAVDAAVAAALAANASPGGSNVVPLSTAVRRRRTQVGLAAAAAVVTVVLGLNSLVGDDPGDNGQTAALRDSSGYSDGGTDLGDQSDARVLADRVRTVVEGEPGAEMASPTADSAEAGSGGASGSGAAAQSEAGAPASESEALVTGKRAAATAARQSTGPCTATARSEYGRGLGDLVFQGTLRWEGTPAVVLAYRIEGATGPLDHRVLVLARDDCRLLVAQTI